MCAIKEAEEEGGADHEEQKDEKKERLPGDGRRAGPDLAVPAARHCGADARSLGEAAPIGVMLVPQTGSGYQA
jgi:hypothetical protein